MSMNPQPCGACWGVCHHKYSDGRQIALNDRVQIAGRYPQSGIVVALRSLGQVVLDVFPRLSITGFPSLRYRTDPSSNLILVDKETP